MALKAARKLPKKGSKTPFKKSEKFNTFFGLGKPPPCRGFFIMLYCSQVINMIAGEYPKTSDASKPIAHSDPFPTCPVNTLTQVSKPNNGNGDSAAPTNGIHEFYAFVIAIVAITTPLIYGSIDGDRWEKIFMWLLAAYFGARAFVKGPAAIASIFTRNGNGNS